MAKLILGHAPKVEAKTFSYGISYAKPIQSQGDLESYVQGLADAEGVPAEAQLTRTDDHTLRVTVFAWDWWEVTL